MDAHRLRSVIDQVVSEHARLGLDARFGHVIQALEESVSSPSCAADEKFRGTLTEMLAALRGARTNDFVESDRRILVELRGDRCTGHGLAERVLAIANERPFLAARAREQFVELADDLQSFLGACAAAQTALDKLSIVNHGPVREQYELGILLPEVVRGDLDRLLAELGDWSRVLGELVPAFSSETPKVALRTFTSRRFEFTATVDRDAALALGTIVAAAHEMFRKAHEHRAKAQELEQQGYPREIVDRMKDYEQLIVQQDMGTLKEALLTRHVREAARRRDTPKMLDRNLRFLATRMRDGVELELLGPCGAYAEAPEDEPAVTHHVRLALRSARRGRPDAASKTADRTPAAAEPAPVSKQAA